MKFQIIIDTLEGFNAWLATASSQVKQSGHDPKNLSVTENAEQYNQQIRK